MAGNLMYTEKDYLKHQPQVKKVEIILCEPCTESIKKFIKDNTKPVDGQNS